MTRHGLKGVAEGAPLGLVPFVSSMFEEWPFLRVRVCIEAVKLRDFWFRLRASL
jgi:hypothetical protein